MMRTGSHGLSPCSCVFDLYSLLSSSLFFSFFIQDTLAILLLLLLPGSRSSACLSGETAVTLLLLPGHFGSKGRLQDAGTPEARILV